MLQSRDVMLGKVFFLSPPTDVPVHCRAGETSCFVPNLQGVSFSLRSLKRQKISTHICNRFTVAEILRNARGVDLHLFVFFIAALTYASSSVRSCL
jgi:hypothetical protein